MKNTGVAEDGYVAGGTTFVDLMKHEVEQPTALVDINVLALHAYDP